MIYNLRTLKKKPAQCLLFLISGVNLGGRPRTDGIGRYGTERYRQEIRKDLFGDLVFREKAVGTKAKKYLSNTVNQENVAVIAQYVFEDMYVHLNGGLIVPENATMTFNGKYK